MTKNLVPLSLPRPELKLAKKDGNIMVWDIIRKKYLVLTPEEWVRQHFVHFLLERGYPQSSIALEGGFYLNQKLQRTDILVYRHAEPRLLVECKAPQVHVSQKTFDQASRYNMVYKSSWVITTNGLQHYVAKVDAAAQGFDFQNKLPDYDEL